MFQIKCIKELQTKYITFRVNEKYSGNRVNNNYWIVDSVGIETKVFEKHFNVTIKDNKEELGAVAKMVNAPDKLNWAIE